MDLSPQDVLRLYGKHLFVINPPQQPQAAGDAPIEEQPAAPTMPAVPPAFLKGGKPINWKLKPESTLALILAEPEFKNKDLTALLKQCMIQSGVALDKIGFGVFDAGCTHFDLSDLPTPLGIMFGAFPAGTDAPVQWETKTVFGAQSLAALHQEEQRQQLILMLKQCQNLM